MKFLARLSIVLLIYIMYGVYLANVELRIVPEIKSEEPLTHYDYRGAINVRSNLSDGTRDHKKIIESAQNAGLDFLFFTEHFSSNLPLLPNSYYDRLLVSSGVEYKYLDSRIFVLGYEQTAPEDMSWKVADWLTQKPPFDRNIILILSTPYSNSESRTWGVEWPSGIDALEVQNSKTIAERSYQSNYFTVVWSLLVYPFSPQYAFLRLYEDPGPELQLWDKIHAQQKLVGVSGLDASARAILSPGSIVEFPSYQTSFELMSTHVLTKNELVGSYERDKQVLFNSIRNGHVYFSLDLLGNPKGFMASYEVNQKSYWMGDEAKFVEGGVIRFRLPSEPSDMFEVVLYRNGQRVAHSNNYNGDFKIEKPGNYRLTVRVSPFFPLPDAKKWVTWIYTNPIYIK